MAIKLNAASRLFAAESKDPNMDDHGYLNIGISFPGHEGSNGYVLRTNGERVELRGMRSNHVIYSIMFLRTDLNGDAAKEAALKQMVLSAFKKSDGDFNSVVIALIKVTKLSSKYFTRNLAF